MAFINDNDAESVFRIMFGKKAGNFFRFIIQAQSLIGGNMDAGVLGRIFTVAGFHNADVITKHCFQFGVGLFTQFIPVAQKQGGLGKALGFV